MKRLGNLGDLRLFLVLNILLLKKLHQQEKDLTKLLQIQKTRPQVVVRKFPENQNVFVKPNNVPGVV